MKERKRETGFIPDSHAERERDMRERERVPVKELVVGRRRCTAATGGKGTRQRAKAGKRAREVAAGFR